MTLAGTRLFATALPLRLMASRLTHSCAYPWLAPVLYSCVALRLGHPGASPIPTTLWNDKERSFSAALKPLALLTPDGNTLTAPLFEIAWGSKPRSWIASHTAV